MTERVARACIFCTKKVLKSNKKIKCSGNQPCQNCTRKSVDCVYVEPKRRGRPHKGPLKMVIKSDQDNDMDCSAGSNTAMMLFPSLIRPDLPLHFQQLPQYGHCEIPKLISHVETIPNGIWSLESFAQFLIPDIAGQLLHWLDVYYLCCSPRVGLIPRHILERNYTKIPAYLYHVMLAHCWIGSSYPKFIFEAHFEIAMKRPEPNVITIYDLLIDIHICAYYYITKNIDACLKWFSRVVSGSRILGIAEGRPDILTTLDQDVSAEFAARSYIYIFVIDYYTMSYTGLPTMVQDDIPSFMLEYFTTNSKNYVPDSHSQFSYYFIPLITIGKKWIQSKSLPEKERYLENDRLMKQLYVWRATLPELDPFPDTDVLLLSLGSFWYSYLLMMSHLIELFILSQRFLTCVENGPLNDAVLLQCEQNVLALTSIIRGTMIHVPDFANMPGLSGYCVFIGAVFLIALGHRKPYLVEQSTAHVSVLLTVTHVSKFLEKAAEMLIQFQQNPVKAIDHLKTICNKS